MENKLRKLASKVTIQDVLDVVHFTIIKKHPTKRNDVILSEIQSIEAKLKNKQLENYYVETPMWWTCVFGDMKENGYVLFEVGKEPKELGSEKPHLTVYLESLGGKDIERAIKAFLSWQKNSEWNDTESKLHELYKLYIEPLGEVGISGLMNAYDMITGELAKRMFDEK